LTYDWANRIRPIAICVFQRQDSAILVAPGYDTIKQQRFYRPLGGEIEFGERAEEAVRREILEELGSEITDVRLLAIEENLFVYQGQQGHELVWVFTAQLKDQSLYERQVVQCSEGEIIFDAEWVPVSVFEGGKAPLYPEGLLELLTGDASYGI
jgi:ADP-ribose pyrophosphatase YjhB (NUDIX family)